mgnify:CR=1 FL=1
MSTNLFNPIDKRKYPSRWPLYRGKQLFRVIDERSDEGTEDLLSVSHITGITPRSQKNVTMFKSESLIGYKLCQMGDIVANTMWTWQGAIGVSKYEGVVSPAYNVYRQRKDYFNSTYLDMLLREHQLVDVYHSLSTGIRPSRLRLYPDVFLTIEFPVPPRAEQDQIVRFLDWKVSEINKLIGIRRKEIQELEELKKSVINDSVKHGLNHTIYKDSGIRWIGQIPDSWKIHKTKQHVIITNGRNPEMKGDIPVYGSGRTSFCTCGEYKNGPAVLLGRKGSIKEPQYITGKYWNVDTAFDVILRLDDFNLKYFYYLATQFEYDYYTTQTAIPSMTQTDYNNISIPVPPLEEQNLIVTFLDSKCEEIDNGINLVKEKIFALQELKSVIISDVVTGKIDVRNIPVPAYEHMDDIVADDGEGNDEETGIPGEED